MALDYFIEWVRLFTKWAQRLLGDPGWYITIQWSDEIEEGCTAEASVERVEYREATILIRRDAPPDNRVACHEIVHLVIAPFAWVGTLAFTEVGVPKAESLFSTWVQQAEESAVDALTRAFLLAYTTEDKGEPSVWSEELTNGRCIVTL